MAAWVWPAAGAAFGVASSLFGGDNQKQEVKPDQLTRNLRSAMFDLSQVHTTDSPWNVWQVPSEAFGYGPHRVFGGPSAATEALASQGIGRSGAPAPYEAAAGDYASQAIRGGYLGANPAMGYLAPYAGGHGGYNVFGGPGRAMMAGTAAGGGYNNPHLDAMVTQAQRRTGANVASMFGRGGMGGSSLEQQLATREMGDIASSMYGRAYEAERGRQTAMQQALGGLETGRLGLGIQQRGQGIGAATTLGQLFGQERGLQQEAAFNVPQLTAADLARIQAGLGISRGLEEYGERQRGEESQAWRQDQLAPFTRLGGITGMFAGVPGGTTTTVQSPGVNPLTAALGGAMTGYGLYRMGGFGGGGNLPAPAPYNTGANLPGGGWGYWGAPGGYSPVPGVPR